LSFEKLDENPVWVGIYGSDGRNIAVYELNTQDHSLIIDTKHFKGGVYHLLIKFENNQTMHKTVIKY
jgi:hypothetical protein